MKRWLAILWLLWTALASANIPRDSSIDLHALRLPASTVDCATGYCSAETRSSTQSAWETLPGLWHIVMHPLQTASGLWGAVTHPGQTIDALTIALAEYADRALGGDARAVGAGAFGLAGMFVPISKVKYLDVAGDVGRITVMGAQGPVIIGETMKRVADFARNIPGAKILDDMPNFSAMGMTDYEVTGAMMRYNRQWILEQMRSGRQIIDIGPDPNRAAPSIFYQMEQNMLKNYQRLHPEFNSVVRP